MVKIVSDGPKKAKKVICSKCTYKLKYTGVDVHSYSSKDISGCTDTYYYITCPKCQEEVSVGRW